MIEFGANYIVINKSWTAFKAVIATKNLPLQWEQDTHFDGYHVFAVDSSLVYLCQIFNGTVPGGSSQEDNDAARADFLANYKARPVIAIDPKNDDGISLLSPEPRTGTELILVTHNFCDPTTWYTESLRSENESLVDSGDGYTWNSAHVNWIDMVHGKLFDEDSICQEVPHGYSVEVKVDGYVKQMREPYANAGGDYSIDYTTGHVVFFTSQSGKTVTASYSYENGSTWKLTPYPGTRIDIEQAEAQFSGDVQFNSDILFDIYVYNPYDLPNKVLYNRSSYKRMTNFIDEALGSYPTIPPIGGTVRGTQSPVYGFPFRYGTVRKVTASSGAELHVSLKDDVAFDGEYATATFYTTVRSE